MDTTIDGRLAIRAAEKHEEKTSCFFESILSCRPSKIIAVDGWRISRLHFIKIHWIEKEAILKKAFLQSNRVVWRVILPGQCRSLLLVVLIVQSFLLCSCASTPSESFLKEAAIYSCYGGGSYADTVLNEYDKNTVRLEKFKVTEKYDKKIDDENYTIYKYLISVHDTKTQLTDNLSCSAAVIKRGPKWYYRLP